MNFKEDWWIPVLIILGLLFLYQIFTQNSGYVSNSLGTNDNLIPKTRRSSVGARNYNPSQH